MHTKSTLWLAGLCLGLSAWLYYDVSSVEIAYNLNNYLINASTGDKLRPIDLVDLNKILHPRNDYVNTTNAMRRLFDLAQQTNYENIFSNHQHYSNQRDLEQSGWPVANQTACGLDLAWIQRELAASKDFALLDGQLGQELTRLMDSFGKPGPGFYSGVLTWPGSYEQCKGASLDQGRIRTRYCMAMMRPRWWPANESGFPKTRVKIGICIPETCDSLSFDAQRDKIDALIKLELSDFLRENLVFESMYCLPDERSPVRQLSPGGRVYFGLLGAWLALIIVASLIFRSWQRAHRKSICLPELSVNMISKEQAAAQKSLFSSGILKGALDAPAFRTNPPQDDNSQRQEENFPKALIKALSLQNTWAAFKSNRFENLRARSLEANNEIRVDLAQLDFIKFWMAIAIVFCHGYILVNFYATSLSHRIQISVGPFFYGVANLSKIVDSFFLINGLLAAYTLLRKIRPEQLSSPLTWLSFNARTMIRFAPVYVLMYWFAKTTMALTGDGPWWDYGTYRYSVRGICMHEPWWRSIPYLSRVGEQSGATCVPVGWFIVTLAQISLVVPPIIYILRASTSHLSRLFLLAFVTLISAAQLVLKVNQQSTLKGESFGTHGAFMFSMMEKFESMGGMASTGRLSSVAYGCFFGYLLHLYEAGTIREWPRWLVAKTTIALLLIAHLVVLLIPLVGFIYLNYSQHITTAHEFVSGYIFGMIVWPALNGALILVTASELKHARFNRVMSHPFWHTANKLGLALYLVHWNVLEYLIASYQGGPSSGYIFDALKLGSFGLIVSLCASFVITMLYDAPLIASLTLLMDKLEGRR